MIYTRLNEKGFFLSKRLILHEHVKFVSKCQINVK